MDDDRALGRILHYCLAAVLICGVAVAQEVPSYSEIEANRDALLEWLATDKSGADFYTESVPFEGGAETKIALILEGIDLEEASATLTGPDAWCEIMFLHLNVKACTYYETENGQSMKLYMGRKFYQKPKKAKQIELDFNTGITEDGVSWVTLTADEGPFNTSDYFIGLFAIEAGNGAYAMLQSSQKVGKAASGAADLYFKTLGAKKVGFSVIGTHKDGSPKYSKGAQAALERNVVRYLLALRAYMQTYELDGVEGLRKRAALWYDATEHHAEQLHEVDRADYLHDKEKEYRNQAELQAKADEQ